MHPVNNLSEANVNALECIHVEIHIQKQQMKSRPLTSTFKANNLQSNT